MVTGHMPPQSFRKGRNNRSLEKARVARRLDHQEIGIKVRLGRGDLVVFPVVIYQPTTVIELQLIDPRLDLSAGLRAINTSGGAELKIFNNANSQMRTVRKLTKVRNIKDREFIVEVRGSVMPQPVN